MIAIVHHGGCPDGVASAWVAWTHHRSISNEEIQIIPASYGVPLPEWEDPGPDVVYVLDFSWGMDTMVRLAKRCGKLVWLDHHQTALDDWVLFQAEGGVPPENLVHDLDLSRSGAMITWQHLNPPHKRPPLLIEYVQDRDLWRWEMPMSREVGSYILTLGETVEEWDEAMWVGEHSLRSRGVGAHAFEQAAVRSALKSARWCVMTAPDGESREFPIFPSPYILGSTGCEQLMEIAGTDMAGYFIDRNDNTVQLGFRSRNGVTVHDWAKKFGGGGHPPSSGCTLPLFDRRLPEHHLPVKGV